MKKLEKIYNDCGLDIPSAKIEPKEFSSTEGCQEYSAGKVKFFLNWELLSKIEENYYVAPDESDQLEEYFSNEKLIEEEIIYSSKIEGIDLLGENSEEENTEEKELKLEYKDAYKEAFTFLLEQEELTHNVLEKVKNIFSSSKITKNEMTNNNMRYRDGHVGIFKSVNGVDKEIHKAVPHTEIKKSLDDVFKYFNGHLLESEDEHPISISATVAVTHCLFEFIHPYFDGNGRIGRMLMNWFLRQTRFPATSYFLSDVIDNNKSKYYKSLEHSQKSRDLTYHAAFMYAALTEAISIYTKVTYVLSEERLTEKQVRFFKKLLISGMNNKKVSYPEIKSKFSNQSKQSFFKMADKLVEKGILREEKTSKVRYFWFPEISF